MALKNQTAGFYSFAADGHSTNTDALGMREMQALAYAKRNAQYLLIKAPPACGKSRALMFLALDKLQNQGIEKVIIAVPQKAIASSFKSTHLPGFGTDWVVDPQYDLCSQDKTESSNVKQVHKFFKDPAAQVLICAHPTLIRFYDSVQDKSLLDHTLVGIDEFHHVSAAEENQLGGVVHSLLNETTAHIVAMTGSYFRGDRIPVLDAKDEQLFEQVIYTYYQQLNGYRYLKNLKLDYSFYDGPWLNGLDLLINPEHEPNNYSSIKPKDYLNPKAFCIDPDMGKPNIALKTIIYIPNINSVSSTGDKVNEFAKVCEILGKPTTRDGTLKPNTVTGFYHLKTRYGTTIKVANLIFEDLQGPTLARLRKIKDRDDVDVIVALGMAKEGFDWPWCEQVIVSGFRQSLTEVVQIIGRATRDCEGKPIAKFINLVPLPEVQLNELNDAVDDLIKAISLSLMMEQVLAPNIKFVPRSEFNRDLKPPKKGDKPDKGEKTIIIDDEHISPKVKSFIKEDNTVQDLATHVINNLGAFTPFLLQPEQFDGDFSPLLNGAISSLIEDKLDGQASGWEKEDYTSLAEIIRAQLILSRGYTSKPDDDENKPGDGNGDDDGGDRNGDDGTDIKKTTPSLVMTDSGEQLLKMRENFINVSDLNFTLIDKCNPFGEGFEFLSRNLSADVLRAIRDEAVMTRAKVTEAEVITLWPEVVAFMKARNNKEPNLNSSDMYERRLAEVFLYVRNSFKKREQAKI